MNLKNIQRIPAVQFTYDVWRAGSLAELGIPHREYFITHYKNRIKELAVGYTEGYKLHVRPKNDYVAVMFFVDNRYFWTHLTIKEFKICFEK
jgi:hypothetical protein